MEIAALNAFIAAAEEASFSKAAERLFITQPAVSKRITALENELAVRLFDREGRRIRLTEAGRLLLPHAQEIIRHIEHSRELMRSLSGTVSGSLRMASSHHIGLHRLPAVLKHYARRYPEVELDLKFLDSETACQQVERGDLEFALITLPETLPGALTKDVIWKDPLAIVTARDTPAAGEALFTTSAILPPRSSWTRQLIDRSFANAGITIRTLIETNNLETIRRMVEIGLGWSVLPATMFSSALRTTPTEIPGLSRELGIIRHRKRTPSNAGAAMIELLKRKEGAKPPPANTMIVTPDQK